MPRKPHSRLAPPKFEDRGKLIRRGSKHRTWLLLVAATAGWGCVEQTGPVLSDTLVVPAPAAIAPLPTPEQLAWQTQEMAAILHFGINTFTDSEQGDGTDNPMLFNPTSLDASQWMTTLRNAGFHQAMLTAKHHDGFCLWPSTCTTYSVASSPWLGGKGDVVRQFVVAAHEANLRVGLAVSPLDKNAKTYGTPAYEAFFKCQLTELLTNYGPIDEIWLWDDPATAPGFDWKGIHAFIHGLQPSTLVDVGNVVSSPGADVRSAGLALVTGPSDQTSVKPNPNAPSPPTVWYPAEALYWIRPDWFWHARDDTQLTTLTELIDDYYNSVGRNSLLVLDVPPNTAGLIANPDVAQLDKYATAIRDIYQMNVAAAQPAVADSVFRSMPTYSASMAVDGKLDTFWAAAEGRTTARIEVDFGTARSFDIVSLQEPIALGERVTQHHVEAKMNGTWTTIATGTAIGERMIHRVGALTATGVALVITQARAAPAITEFGVYQTQFP